MKLNEYVKEQKIEMYKNIDLRYRHNKTDRDYIIEMSEHDIYKGVSSLLDEYKIKYHFLKLEEMIQDSFTVPVTRVTDNFMTNVYEIQNIMIGNQVRNIKNIIKAENTVENKRQELVEYQDEYTESITKLQDSKIEFDSNFKALMLTIASKYRIRQNKELLIKLAQLLISKEHTLERSLNQNKRQVINQDEDDVNSLYKYVSNNTNLDSNELIKKEKTYAKTK